MSKTTTLMVKGIVLIVDDTPANLFLLSNLLNKEGYNCLEATDGKQALSLAQEHQPDLILLEIVMPDLDGYGVIKELKNNPETEDIPVIFLSSLSGTNDKVEAFKAGAVDYITKPVQKEETLARVKAHVQIRSLQKQLGNRIRILKEREAELRELNQQKDKLVRMVSHDIKNPLSGIIGLASFMKNHTDIAPQEQANMCAVIEKSGDNLLKMVNELLDHDANNLSATKLTLSETNLKALVERVVAIHQAKSISKEIELTYSVQPENITARVDAGKIEILLSNIVANALKFTPSGGNINIDIGLKSKDDLLIKVADTGIGMPDEMLDGLFFAGKKRSRTGTGGETGTRLGLDIVKLYVERHEGKVWAESNADGGLTFFIELPLKNNS